MNGVLSKRIPEAENFDFSLEQFYSSSEELLNHCLENKTKLCPQTLNPRQRVTSANNNLSASYAH